MLLPAADVDTAVGTKTAVVVAVGSGLLLDLAFPGVGWWPLAPVSIGAFLAALAGRGPRAGAGLGLLFGLAFFIPHLAWSGIYVGAMPWLALASLQSLYVAAFGVAVSLAWRRYPSPATQVLLAGCLWVGQEALRSRTPFGGFPWGRLAFSQVESPAVGLAALGGAPLVSFAVATAGALLAQAAISASKPHRHVGPRRAATRSALAFAGLAVAVTTTGAAVPRSTEVGPTVRVAAVQGNVARPGLDFASERRAVLDNHARATRRLAADIASGRQPRPDLVLWPENSSDLDPLRESDAASVISGAVDAVDVPVLIGAVLREPTDKLSNASLVWEPGRGPTGRYVKHRPVPFAEYIPYRSFFRRISDKVDLVRTDFIGAQGPVTVAMGRVRVGVAICFEVAFDDQLRSAVREGADLLVVPTNNATFGRSDESVQQLAMSRLRAIELGRSIAHVSTVGVSALIRPDGTMAKVSRHFTQETLTAELPLRTNLSLAARLGTWPEGLLTLLGLAGLATGTCRSRRGSARPPTRRWHQRRPRGSGPSPYGKVERENHASRPWPLSSR